MIEILSEQVKMPSLYDRKFQKDFTNNKWSVIDKETNSTVYKGKFEDVCLAWHSLNKKYYKNK